MIKSRQTALSRRKFLGFSSSLLSLPFVIPASAAGRGRRQAPSERITMGFIGTGGRGTYHLRSYLNNPGTQILGVCDPYQSKRRNALKVVEDTYNKKYGRGVYGSCEDYSDFRELIARDDIDAVIVSSTENWHAIHMAHAVKSGKDVYGEKALSLTVDEGRRLCKAVRRYGRILQVGTQQRSGGNFRFACELVRNGYIGKLHTVKVGVPGGRALPVTPPAPVPEDLDYEMWLGPAPYTPFNKLKCTYNWYFIYDYCAGWIQSWGVHHCDIAQWGAPDLIKGRVSVSGKAVFPTEGLANTSITWHTEIKTKDGLLFSFADNRHPGHQQGCRFIGDKGEVFVNRGGIWATPQSLLSVRIKPEEEHLYVSRSHHNNFLNCIRTRRDPVAPVEAGHTATTLTLISDIATRLKRKLVWDWEKEHFINDAEANSLLSRPMRSPWKL